MEHARQGGAVARSVYGGIGNAAEQGYVKHAVVRGAVLAHPTGAVQTQNHREVLQGNVVDPLIDGALKKGAVQTHHGLPSGGGQGRRGGDRMLFGNAHVNGTVRMNRPEAIQARARRHGRG